MAKNIQSKDCTVTLECLPEETEVCGNAMASGDDAIDREAENEIFSQLRRGNDWAWCCAHVVVTYKGLKAESYLGCCSYKSEADFKNGGYYDDMVYECVAEINEKAQAIAADVCLEAV